MKRYKSLLRLAFALVMLLAIMSGCAANNVAAPEAVPEADLTESGANENPSEDVSVDNGSFSYSDGIDENGFFEGITALDYVKDFNYQGLSIPEEIHKISPELIEAEIDNMLADYASSEQVTDRAVVDGDTVNIDYVGSVDGVEFDGGSTGGAGTDVTIGVTSYIDDFLEQLIGHKPGETINVEVTFPDVYHEESLQGKDAVFVTTINHIVDKKQPDLTDEFVKESFFDSNGWETIAAMREGLSEHLQDTAIQSYISEYLINEVPFISIPDELTDYQEKAMLRYYMDAAEYYGADFEEFLSTYVGVSGVDELIEGGRERNLQNASYALALQAVAEGAKLSVGEEDLTEFFPDRSQYEELYGLPYMKQIILFQKAVDYIAEHSALE